MTALRLLAPAKINLFLHIVGRRTDGYHLLQSAFELLDWSDTIHLTTRPESDIRREGDVIGALDQDLAVRAARALQSTTQWQGSSQPGVMIRVDKVIPAGAGLGGGSSDAATTLYGLNRLWGLDLSAAQLAEIGLTLGADVPFFLFGRSAFAQGIGENLSPFNSIPRWVVVAVPACPVPTGRIFQSPELTRNSKPLKIADFAQAASHPVWDFGHNDLEPVTRALFPDVDLILNWLSQAADCEGIAPEAVRMSGSGGAVFCTAPDHQTARRVFHRLEEFQSTAQGYRLAHLKLCQTLMTHPERRS